MRKFLRIFCGIAAGLLAMPALAQEGTTDSGLYFSFGGGLSEEQLLNAEWTQTSFLPPDEYEELSWDVDYSLIGLAAIGYAWVPEDSPADFRLELEGSYRRAEIGSLTYSIYCGCGALNDQTVYSAEGYLETIGAMANGFVDFHLGDVITPFLGAGFGMVRVSRKDMSAEIGGGTVLYPDKYVHTGAWQLMAGVGFHLTPGTVIGFEFRHFELVEFRFENQLISNEVNFGEFIVMFRLVG